MVRRILLFAEPAISTPPGSNATLGHIPSHPHNVLPYDQSYCFSHIPMWIIQTDLPYQNSVCTGSPYAQPITTLIFLGQNISLCTLL
jgi:hypothetical protein